MSNIIIIGIANPFRGDDGAGWAVLDLLGKTLSVQVKLSKQRGDIAELIDAFTQYSTVYLIDACQADSPDGSWLRIDLLKQALPHINPPTSTHGFNLSETLALAKNLDALPEKLIMYAICGSNYSIGSTLSVKVHKAVESVAQSILNEKEVLACMNKI